MAALGSRSILALAHELFESRDCVSTCLPLFLQQELQLTEGGGGARSGNQAFPLPCAAVSSPTCRERHVSWCRSLNIFSHWSLHSGLVHGSPASTLKSNPLLLTAFLSPKLFQKGLEGPWQGSTLPQHDITAFSSWHCGASRHTGYGVQS